MDMASHGISLGWWLLSCMGSPALALCPELVGKGLFPAVHCPGSTPEARQRVSYGVGSREPRGKSRAVVERRRGEA